MHSYSHHYRKPVGLIPHGMVLAVIIPLLAYTVYLGLGLDGSALTTIFYCMAPVLWVIAFLWVFGRHTKRALQKIGLVPAVTTAAGVAAVGWLFSGTGIGGYVFLLTGLIATRILMGPGLDEMDAEQARLAELNREARRMVAIALGLDSGVRATVEFTLDADQKLSTITTGPLEPREVSGLEGLVARVEKYLPDFEVSEASIHEVKLTAK